MIALRKVRIRHSWLAGALVMLSLFWDASHFLGSRAGKGFVSNLPLFWVAIFVMVPWLCGLLMATMIYMRATGQRAHPTLFWVSLMIGVMPVVWWGWLWIMLRTSV